MTRLKVGLVLLAAALPGAQWSGTQRLGAPYAGYRDGYGATIAADRMTLVVGDQSAGEWGVNGPAGAVFIYRRRSDWQLETRLDNPDNQYRPAFGRAVAISGSLIAVGDPWRDYRDGTAYLYSRTGNRWQLASVIHTPDSRWSLDFGDLLALDGKTLIVRAVYHAGYGRLPALLYVFDVSDPHSPLLITRLEAPAATDEPFGECVSVSGDYMVASSRLSSRSGPHQGGVVFVYRQTSGSWTLQGMLAPSDPQTWAQFGCPLQLQGSRLAITAPGYSTKNPAIGAVYVFDLASDGVFQQSARLTASDAQPNDWFGSALALDGDRVVAGAWRKSLAGLYSGAAYVFDRSRSGAWLQTQRLTPAFGFEYLRFGLSAAAGSDTLFIGAPGDLVDGRYRGAVHVYRATGGGGFSSPQQAH